VTLRATCTTTLRANSSSWQLRVMPGDDGFLFAENASFSVGAAGNPSRGFALRSKQLGASTLK